jgi:outer membrane protein TolC
VIAAAALAALPVFAYLSPREAQARTASYSAEVRVAIATERERESALQSARVAAVPHLTGDYTLSPQAGATDTSTVEQHMFVVGAGINVSDILASSDAIRVAASDVLEAQRDVETAQLEADETALKLYFDALRALAVEALRTQSVTDAKRQVHIARLRVRAGDAPRLDAVRADVALAQARAELYRATADAINALEALADATRVPAERLRDLTSAGEVPLQTPDPDDAVARALARRPELRALMAAADAREAGIAAARMSSLPSATVQAGYASGVDTGIRVDGPQVAAHVDIPIASTSSFAVAAARARADAAYASLDAERRRIALEVTAAVRDEHATDLAAAAAETARSEASQALSGIELGYREGASSASDVAEARRTYEQAALDALTAKYQQAAAHWSLELLIP